VLYFNRLSCIKTDIEKSVDFAQFVESKQTIRLSCGQP